jgi:hypothetical protein
MIISQPVKPPPELFQDQAWTLHPLSWWQHHELFLPSLLQN